MVEVVEPDDSKKLNEGELPPDVERDVQIVLDEFALASSSSKRLAGEAQQANALMLKQVAHAENAERVRGLNFVELTLDPSCPETCEAMQQLGALYNAHLISDEALRRLRSGDGMLYKQEMEAGKMMNLFHPTGRVREKYNELLTASGSAQTYESVQEQMIRDLLGCDSYGTYRAFALRSPNDSSKLVASLTLRIPPSRSAPKEEKDLYASKMEAFLSRMQCRQFWDERKFYSEIPIMAEIDTLLADPAFPSAGTRLVYEVLRTLKEEDRLPFSFMYYRCDGIRTSADDQERAYPKGANLASGHFFMETLAFTEMADRCDGCDIMVREIDPKGELFVAKPHWAFGHKRAATLVERVSDRVEQRNLIDGSSALR